MRSSSRHLIARGRTRLGLALLAIGTAATGTALFSSADAAVTPPAPTITSGPAGTVNTRSATFTYTNPQTVTFKCALDSTALTACPAAAAKNGTISYSNLNEGAHTFRVLAQSASNQSTFASRSWTVDTTRPAVLSINRLDPNPIALGNVRWTVTFSEPVVNVTTANFSVKSTGLGGQPTIISLSPAAGPAAAYLVTANTGLTSASANPSVRLDLSRTGSIQDLAGNRLADDFDGQTYAIDATAPVVTLTKVNGNTATFPFTTGGNVTSFGGTCGKATGDLATITVSISGPLNTTGTTNCTNGTWTYGVLINVNGTFSVKAGQSDSAGNTGTSGSKTIIRTAADSVPPAITLTSINGSTSVNGSTIGFPLTTNVQVSSIGGSCGTVAGDNATVSVNITGPQPRSGTAPCTAGTWLFTVTPPLRNAPAGVDDGVYTLSATQTDAAGNSGTTGPKQMTLATLPFGINGNAVTALRPGTSSDLQLTITNPYSFPIKVESIAVSFVGSGGCDGPANFSVARPFSGPVTVGPGATVLTAAIAPRVQMLNLDSPQDNCKLANITLAYNGMASRA